MFATLVPIASCIVFCCEKHASFSPLICNDLVQVIMFLVWSSFLSALNSQSINSDEVLFRQRELSQYSLAFFICESVGCD